MRDTDDTSRSRPSLSASSVLREARQLVWARRRRLALGLALMVVSRLAGMVLPATPKVLLDEIVAEGRSELLLPLAGLVAVATVVQAVTSFLVARVLGVAAQAAITEMRRRVQRHVLRLPVGYFDTTSSGVLISRIMTDAQGIRNLVGSGLVQLAGGLLTATLALAVLLYLNWRLTLITVTVLVAFGGFMAFAFSRLRPIFRERGRINAEVTGRLSEALSGVRIVKAYTAEKREQQVFTSGVHDLLRNVATTITGVSGVGSGATLIFGAVGIAILVIGGRSILAGSMTLGEFMTYVFFTGLLVSPIIQVSSIATQLSEAFAGLDRIRELLDEPPEEAAHHGVAMPRVTGEVVFEEVEFAYEPGQPVLEEISLCAPAGSTTALVGPSGAGKSTLIGLVSTFHRPSTGRILVDGRNLSEVRLADYRAHLGVVLQENFLFDGTLAENIAYGKPGANRAEIEEVGRIAHCDQFVAAMEGGYETVIGERGVRLSGGQRQRVAIARAILADPAILLLDEATSSLDSESEALIQDALGTLRRGRTTFVIAHRLSTIRSADQILVLDAGRIVERGSHAELLATDGLYRALHDRQHATETDRHVNPGEGRQAEAGATGRGGG